MGSIKKLPHELETLTEPQTSAYGPGMVLGGVKDHSADEQQDESLHATLITVHYKGTRIPWKNPNLMKVLFSRVTVHYWPHCAVKTPKVEKKKKKRKCRAAGCVAKSSWGWTFTILLYHCRREDATCSKS